MNGMCALCAATACTNNKEFNTLKIRCREKFINTSECVDLCNNFYNIDLIHRLIMQSAVQSAFRCAFSRAHTFTHCQADRISFIRKDNFSWAFSVFFSSHFPFQLYSTRSIYKFVYMMRCRALFHHIDSAGDRDFATNRHLNSFRIFEMHATHFPVSCPLWMWNEERWENELKLS